MKNVLLKLEDKEFFKLKENKLKKEKEISQNLTWEDYFNLLIFGKGE